MICHICKKEIINGSPFCHLMSDMRGMDVDFYTHLGDCYDKFRNDDYDPIDTRFEILDL